VIPGNGDDDPNRAGLFPSSYRDDPDIEASAGQNDLNNEQIHAYHSRVLGEQDEQLDALSHSIGRTRELSIQIGDELEEHVQMLDDVDRAVDRHQTRLDGARKRLGHVARKAKDNVQLSIIFVLIVILVLLIIVLK
jgi:syntaxin 8